MNSRRKRLLYFAPVAIVGFAVFAALGGAVVRMLWNWLLPPMFGWHQITFWQALALLALCRILFGRFGFGGPARSYRRRMRDRWEGMTPEERERFRERMKERWGGGPWMEERP